MPLIVTFPVVVITLSAVVLVHVPALVKAVQLISPPIDVRVPWLSIAADDVRLNVTQARVSFAVTVTASNIQAPVRVMVTPPPPVATVEP